MRYQFILIIGLLISCNNSKQPNGHSDKANKIDIEKLEKEAFEKYQESPIAALPIFKQVANEYERLENYKKAGFTNLNIANIYDEHKNQVDSALLFSQKSLEIWEAQNDSLQIANLFKYIGFLKGRKGQFEEAKTDIHNAIKMYQELEFDQGTAVSEINLADVYYRQKDYDNSLRLFHKSTEYWNKTNDLSRVYTNNILGIKIYHALHDSKKTQQLIEENESIEQQIQINEYMKMKFVVVINETKS